MENPEHKFELIFSGQITEGADPEKVRDIAARVFHATPDQLARLFSGNTIILKSNLSESGANTFREKLVAVGFVCAVRPMASAESEPKAAPTPPAASVEDASEPTPVEAVPEESPAPVEEPIAAAESVEFHADAADEAPQPKQPQVFKSEPLVTSNNVPEQPEATVEFDPEPEQEPEPEPEQIQFTATPTVSELEPVAPEVASQPEQSVLEESLAEKSLVEEEPVPDFDYDLSDASDDNDPLDYEQTIAEIDADLDLESESALDFSAMAIDDQPSNHQLNDSDDLTFEAPAAPSQADSPSAPQTASASTPPAQETSEAVYTNIPTDSDDFNLFDELLDDDDIELDDQGSLTIEETEAEDISAADMEYLLHENEDEDDDDFGYLIDEDESDDEDQAQPVVSMGAEEIEFEPVAPPAVTPAPAAVEPTPKAAMPAAEDWSIAPAGSQIDIETRTPPPPMPDTSHLDVQERVGYLFDQNTTPPPPAPDTSHLSLVDEDSNTPTGTL